MAKLIKLTVTLLLAGLLIHCMQKPELVMLSGATMGTTYSIKYDPIPKLDSQALQSQINSKLALINKKMSTYDPTSELSMFNKMGPGQVHLSDETAHVMAAAYQLNRLTLGALDISVGPLVNLWGFGPDKRPTVIPTTQTIQAVKANTGLHQTKLDGAYLTKYNEDIYLDLSTIAKGYAVDAISEHLLNLGVANFMVEIGGEVRTNGQKPDGQPWRIAVEKPQQGSRSVQMVLSLGDISVATSGDYRNFYQLDGKRLSHIIDPKTGQPIEHSTVSVTVLHPSNMIADGLATGLMVMGTEQALKVANQENIAAFFIDTHDNGFKLSYSEAFKPYLPKEVEK